MELLDYLLQTTKNAKSFKKVKNFYFENHICSKDGNNKKIPLDYKLSTDNSDKIMKFGICQDCQTLFYCYDFESRDF